MPGKGRKYHNDDKVLDRLKTPINIIKCKKTWIWSNRTGSSSARRNFRRDPIIWAKPEKNENLQKIDQFAKCFSLLKNEFFFSLICFSRCQTFYSILPVSPTLYRKYEIFVEISVERGLLVIYKSGQATKKQYQKLTVVC